MTKICFKLFGGLNRILLNAPIKFTKIRVVKLRYITANDYEGILSIKLQGLNLNSYIDSTKIFDYFFIMFVDNTMNRLINFIQQDDSWEYNGSIQTFNNFTFDIYMDGAIDNGITINNPFLIELEYF